jgi:hypothetical protein
MHSTDVSPRLKAIGVLILIVFLAVTITSAVTERPASAASRKKRGDSDSKQSE